MQRFLIPSAIVLVVGSMGVTHVRSMQRSLDRLESMQDQVPARLLEMREELSANESKWTERVAELNAELTTLKADKQSQAGSLSRQLEEATASLEDQRDHIEALQNALQDRDVEGRLKQVYEQFSGLSESVNSTRSLVETTRADLGKISETLTPREAEVSHRWRRIVAPTVQLSGATTVGSGVVLRSTERADGQGHETLMLTAWHVVRDILADKIDPLDQDIPVTVYLEDGRTQHRTAKLLGKNATIDAALLRLEGDEPVTHGATLASRSYLRSRRIFHSVYAVGCPLGNDPIPTPGEIADLDHYIDGSTYWMISAPTYIGNSGGGIYDGSSNHLMGLFSKIYTHGNLRPTIVPHMGLVSPMELVYDWLESEGIASVVPEGDAARIVVVD